ncbi:hypothetical protein C5167_046370 [Papaver somniferum]|uniref:peptide-methionine (S)-S-oxide reductase n=3 Tax=Papaver somniferum TaxID=3469 RepID=A0A4Y7LDK9_PAPSO|nr:hypothetical protein C5167_046370 [Papaver somniferum]
MEGGGGATPAAVADKRQKSLPVEIATATAKNGLFGAALGDLFSRIPPKTPVISARSCAVFGGVYGGTMCAMRQITGKDDTKNIMVAGFTSGFMFHLVGRMPSRPRVPAAVGTGLFVSVSYGLIHEHVCLYIYLDTGHQIEVYHYFLKGPQLYCSYYDVGNRGRNDTQIRITVLINWQPLQQHWIKINSDGAARGNPGTAVLMAMATPLEITSAITAETWRLLLATRLEKQQLWPKEIRSLMESIPQTKITHDYREANLAADKLANDGRSSTTTPGDIINKNNLKVMNQARRMTSHGPGTIHMHSNPASQPDLDQPDAPDRTTNHSEVVRIHYDPNLCPYTNLPSLFWSRHDPTTLNRQSVPLFGPILRNCRFGTSLLLADYIAKYGEMYRTEEDLFFGEEMSIVICLVADQQQQQQQHITETC